MSHSFSFSHCITLISKSLHFSWCPCWFNRWRREVCSCFHCFCCFFKAAGSSVEIEAFPLFYYSRRRRRRHSFSFFGFGKALCLETTFAISQLLLPTHQGNFRNLLSLASSFLCKLATVNRLVETIASAFTIYIVGWVLQQEWGKQRKNCWQW